MAAIPENWGTETDKFEGMNYISFSTMIWREYLDHAIFLTIKVFDRGYQHVYQYRIIILTPRASTSSDQTRMNEQNIFGSDRMLRQSISKKIYHQLHSAARIDTLAASARSSQQLKLGCRLLE